jgi:phage terminase small subunit
MRNDKGLAPPEIATALTAKQRLFVTEYLVDLNGTQAAIRAGYSRQSAAVIAYENLRKPHIATEIARALQERCSVTTTRIVDELARIGFSDVTEVVTWRNEVEVQQVKEAGEDNEVRVLSPRITVIDSATLTPEVTATVSHISQDASGNVRVRMHDKVAALEKLSRALGMFKDHIVLDGKIHGVRPVLNVGRNSHPQSASKAVGSKRDKGH